MDSSESTFTLLNSIHQSLKSILYAENFFVVLVSSTKRYVTFPYFHDIKDSISSDELNSVPLENLYDTLTFYALKKKAVVCLVKDDIQQLIEDKEVNVLGSMPEQWLCFPLTYKGNFLGDFVIQSYRSTNEYNQDDINILNFISNVMAAALYLFNKNAELEEYKEQLEIKILDRTAELENTLKSLTVEVEKSKELEDQLTFEAFHDSLTGLYNRKYLVDHLEITSSKSKRNDLNLCIAFLDLDGFKLINDNYGHACGDHVLKVTAERLQSCFRRHDILARFGGDEFVVLICEKLSKEDLTTICNRVLNAVSTPIEYNEQGRVSIGVSIGLARSDKKVVVHKELLALADQALYEAKEKGKGCFVFKL
jgi:diguanylate cyclase (GGDEF)-like protein